MKKIATILLSSILLISSFNMIFAEGEYKQISPKNNIHQRSWPGNPNPKPGTEDWFFQHMDYGGNASSSQAKSCAEQAFNGTYLTEMTGAIAGWIVFGAFSLTAFAVAFGSSYLVSYASCLYSSGVR